MLTKAQLKELLSYQQKKGRKKSNLFLVEGTRLTQEALLSVWEVKQLYCTHSFKENQSSAEILALAKKRGVKFLEIQERALRKMAETENPQGVVAVVEKRELNLDEFLKSQPELVIALDNIRDPGNLGTIIRTADALGVEGIFISRDSVELYNPKVVRGTMGSLFHLAIFYPVILTELIQKLRGRIRILGAVAKGGIPCQEFDFSEPLCLLIGGEAFGLSDGLLKLADEKISIPQYGSAESLNASVAAGILLYEIARFKKMRTKKPLLRNIPKEC